MNKIDERNLRKLTFLATGSPSMSFKEKSKKKLENYENKYINIENITDNKSKGFFGLNCCKPDRVVSKSDVNMIKPQSYVQQKPPKKVSYDFRQQQQQDLFEEEPVIANEREQSYEGRVSQPQKKDPLKFWLPQNVQSYIKYMKIADQFSGGTRGIGIEDKYAQIQEYYNHERDKKYIEVDSERIDSSCEMNYLTEEQFQEIKENLRWDIAWQVFDSVNDDLNTDKEIDLNCLDIEEAQAIAKQKILDVAIMANKEMVSGDPAQNNDFVLAILCGNNHIVSGPNDLSPNGKSLPFASNEEFYEDGPEEFAYPQTVPVQNFSSNVSTNVSGISGNSNQYSQYSNLYQQKMNKNKNYTYQEQPKTIIKNEILDMVKNELELDHFYIMDSNIILVRIDGDTIYHPVLAEW